MKNIFLSTLLVIVVLAVVLLFVRGSALISCSVAESDLGRKTSFSWVSGKCMVENKNGDRVYLNQMRSMEGGE